jgi:hypothetical protein
VGATWLISAVARLLPLLDAPVPFMLLRADPVVKNYMKFNIKFVTANVSYALIL